MKQTKKNLGWPEDKTFYVPDDAAKNWLQAVDKGAKEVPTRSEDGKVKLVKVNQPYRDDKTGEMMVHNLSQGNYEPAISTGPSYNSQRQQANDAYGEIATADKNFMTIAGDLYFRTSDMPGADQIADRYEKMLPPQLRPAPPPNEAQQQQTQQALQQLSAQQKQQTVVIHQLSEIIEQKRVEATSREKIAAMQVWGNVRIAGIAAGNKQAIADSNNEAARLEGIFDRAHEHALATLDDQQQDDSQQQDQAHALGMQAVQQDHAQNMQQDSQDAASATQATQIAAQQQAAAQQPQPKAA